MAKIFGTIESLKSLKSDLEINGVTRFNSVKDIKEFLTNYEYEKSKIIEETSKKLDRVYIETCNGLEQKIQLKNEIINSETKKIDSKISDLRFKIDSIKSNEGDSFFKYITSFISLKFNKIRLNHLIQNKPKLIKSSIKDISNQINADEYFKNEYENNKQRLIDRRTKYKLEKLEHTKRVVDKSRNLIAGTIGENLVVKEIEKLDKDYILINDFKLSFSTPIYYARNNERIYSIQIDHLLILKSGIYIIETKNWSKSSVNSMSLRSPVEQIRRSNFALYVFISENIELNNHHWGEKKVPVRNVIVMINNKPKTKFKYVSIKLLQELNSYIRYFEPTFSDQELNSITRVLNYHRS